MSATKRSARKNSRPVAKGKQSSKQSRHAPYARPQAKTQPATKTAAATRTANKLAALGLSSMGSASSPFKPTTSHTTAIPAKPVKADAATKIKDGELRETLDAELGSVLAALTERSAAKKMEEEEASKQAAEAGKRREQQQQNYERMENDYASTLDMLGAL